MAQVPIGLAGPLRINGEHAQGDFYIPLGHHRRHAGRELQPRHAPAQRMRRRQDRRWSSSPCSARRSSIFDDALKAREFGLLGRRAFRRRSAQLPKPRRAFGKLINIEQYAVGPLRHLRFNYTTGDAAGQNMTGKATLAACEWITAQLPAAARVTCCRATSTPTRNIRTSTCCVTRGKRVVAEVRDPQREPLKRLMGVDASRRCSPSRQVSNAGAFLAGSANNGAHAANGLAAMFIATGQDVANVAESHAGIVYSAVARTTATTTGRSRCPR